MRAQSISRHAIEMSDALAQANTFARKNGGLIGGIVFCAVLVFAVFALYTYLYPSEQVDHTVFIPGEADARKPIDMKSTTVPPIYTGGDWTMSMWIYIDDWNYRVANNKFLFALSPDQPNPHATSVLTGVLTPLQNGLMIRANTVKSGGQQVPGTEQGPDITVESNLQALLNQQTSMTMFSDPTSSPCDIREVPVQRWVCLTMVVSGRVLDVYMDGKLTRSCVLDNVVNVPRQKLRLRLGESGGFGGLYSSVQMWSQQLTPDVVYAIYQMGPVQTRHPLFARIGRLFNLNVTFTEGNTGSDAHSMWENGLREKGQGAMGQLTQRM